MEKIKSYEFNIDTARVELVLTDVAMLVIDTIAVGSDCAANLYEFSKLAT